MLRKRRTVLVLLAFLAATAGALGVWLWREDCQERLDRRLIAAIKRDDVPAAVAALDRGADANARDVSDEPLWRTVWNRIRWGEPSGSGQETAVYLSVVYYKDPSHHGRPGPWDDDPRLVRLLAAHGARINSPDEYGNSPLYYAVTDDKIATARALFECGAECRPGVPAQRLLVDAVQGSARAEMVSLVLDHGADPNGPGPEGATPLGEAVSQESADVVRCLLSRGADPNKPSAAIVDHPATPLELAAKNSTTEIAKLLRAAGAREYRQPAGARDYRRAARR